MYMLSMIRRTLRSGAAGLEFVVVNVRVRSRKSILSPAPTVSVNRRMSSLVSFGTRLSASFLSASLLLAFGIAWPGAAPLTPEECKEKFKACVCYYVEGRWVCEGIGPKGPEGEVPWKAAP